jgi:hypothetical protein
VARRFAAPPQLGDSPEDDAPAPEDDEMAQPASAPRRAVEGGGWLTFAAVIFLIAAAFNTLYGLAALVNDDYFAVDELLFGDLSMWGVIYLIFAAAQLATALFIISRRSAGAVLGIGLASLHAIVVLMSIGAYPVWSVVLLVVDGMIIYGLTVYGFAD